MYPANSQNEIELDTVHTSGFDRNSTPFDYGSVVNPMPAGST